MTIHFEITPPVLEIACHTIAAFIWIMLGTFAADNQTRPGPLAATFIALMAILFNSFGANL